MIVRVQTFIDFVNVKNLAREFGVQNNFHINKIYKHLILNNHFGGKTKKKKKKHQRSRTTFCDGGSKWLPGLNKQVSSLNIVVRHLDRMPDQVWDEARILGLEVVFPIILTSGRLPFTQAEASRLGKGLRIGSFCFISFICLQLSAFSP